MPQDSLRSLVYRSFVTCDDPKGVIERGTNRKSKARSSKTEDKVNGEKTRKKETVSMEVLDDLKSPSSLQLLEVSREAQILNQTIDSWSNGLTFDGQLAKGLLKGAIDLQESLVMLGKLQEASQYTAQFNKKEKVKVDGARSERMNSDRFGDQIYHMGLQNQMLSDDGSSRKLIQELRRAIADSFAKQKMFRISKSEENSNYNGRLDSSNTSSSQSSEIYLNNLAVLKKKKEKATKEIVDDDGIERMDSKRFEAQNHRTRYKPRNFTDVSSMDSIEELKRVIRNSLAEQNLLPNSINGEKGNHDRKRFVSGSEVPSTSSSKFSMVSSNNFGSTSTASSSSSIAPNKAKTPNLIAKLMGLEEFPSKQSQLALNKQMESEKLSNPRRPMFDIEMPKARKPHFVAQKADPGQRTLKEVLDTMQLKGLLKSNIIKVQNKEIVDMPPIVIMKPLQVSCLESDKVRFIDAHTTNRLPKNLKVKDELHHIRTDCEKRFLNTKDNLLKRHSQTGHPMELKAVVEKQKERKAKTRHEVSYKIKPSVPVDVKIQSEDVSNRKARIIRKVIQTGKKHVEINAKSKSPLKSQNANVTLVKTSKHESKSKCAKEIKRNSSPGLKKNRTKNGKPSTEATAANFVMEASEYKDDNSRNNLSSEYKDDNSRNNLSSDIIINNITPANQLHEEEEIETCKIENEECSRGGECSLSEDMPLTNQHEIIALLVKEEKVHEDQNEAQSKSSKIRTTLKDMVFNSPSFITHGKVLHFKLDHPTMSHTSSINELEDSNLKLSLDCVNELLERIQETQPHTWSSRKNLSLEQLVDDVETLQCYNKLGGENSLKDDIVSSMLDQDLICKESLSSIWESGWRIGFSRNEVEQVGVDIEKLALEELVDEIFTDFVF